MYIISKTSDLFVFKIFTGVFNTKSVSFHPTLKQTTKPVLTKF